MITYGSTTLTSYNTITKIEVYYYKSTSATDLTGGSWSTTKPTWENGKYIWQKIKTTYEGKLENGQFYSESDPVNITGQQGATGTAAYSYKLNASDSVIGKTKTGEYTIDKITFTATYKQGTGAVTAYTGRFKIETTANGTTWTTQYTSSGNESSKEYTIPEDIISIRCSLYQSGGTSTLLDIVTIPVVKDGIDAVGLRDSIPYYLASDKQTGVTRLDQGWTRFKPELTTEKRYLWVYYVSRYSEGDTQPELIEIKNDIVSFENHGDESPVENCVIDIEPVQDLHGYDSPWPAGGGENKLDLSTAHFNSCTLVNASTGSVKANIQNSYYSYVTIDSGFFFESLKKEILNGNPITFEVDNNYGYIISIVAFGTRSTGQTYQETGAGNSNITTIIPSDFTSVTRVEFRFLRSNTAYTDVDTVVTGLRVSYGDTATTFSPCSNICPITSFAGENIWDEEWEVINGALTSKNYIPVLPNTAYCFAASIRKYNSSHLAIYLNYHDSEKNLISTVTIWSNWDEKQFVKTTPTNCHFVTFKISSSYGNTYNNDISINYPASFTGYIPYSWKGGMTAHVTRVGKNWFDLGEFATLYPDNCSYSNNTLTVNAISDLYSAGVPCYFPKGTVVNCAITEGTATNVRIRFVFASGELNERKNGQFPYIPPKDVVAIRFNWTTAGTFSVSNFQAEFGSTATDYDPYTGTTYSITFPNEAGTVYGGTLDVTKGELVVDRAIVDLGTLTWAKSESVWRTFYSTGIRNAVKKINGDINVNNFSSVYKTRTNDITSSGDNYIYTTTIGEIALKDTSKANLTGSAFKTAMNGIQFCYPLATPITYTLTPQEITMLTGQNHIFSDTGQTTISYYDNQTSTDPYVDYSATSAFEVAQSVSDAVGTLQAPYKEVEWVESTGKQYVYLDWKPPIKTWGFEIDFISKNATGSSAGAWNETTNVNGYGTIFGVRGASGVNNVQLSSYNNGLLRVGNSTNIATGFKTDHTRQTIKLHNNIITKTDGTTATITRVNEDSSKNYCNMTIFALYNDPLRRRSTCSINEPSSTRIYSLKFYDGDTLTVDLVGAIRKADKVTGLYDKVSKHFYPAPGMLYGNDVGDIIIDDTITENLNKTDVKATVINKNRSRMWEANVPFSKLEDGQKITVTYSYGGIVGSVETTELVGWDDTSSNYDVYLKLVFPNGDKTEWIPCYYSNTSRLTTHYSAGTPITFTYHENLLQNATETSGGSAVVRGFFANASYYSNTSYTQYSNNVKAGANGIKAYTLIMQDSEDTWSCFYSGAMKFTNTGKPAYTGGFRLGKVLYSSGSGAQTSNSSLDTYYNYIEGVTTSAIYDAYPLDFRYSTNCATTLTAQRPVYLVGTVENDGLFHLDVSQWWTQTIPTYEDGKVYVYLGITYGTYQLWLATENPAYVYYNDEFILYDKALTLQNITTLKNSLETQIDGKVETWCQKTNPASSWTATERLSHTGDLWYYTGESDSTYKNNTTYQYNGSTNTWTEYSANPDLFDRIDGKTTIYYGTTTSVTSAETGDYLVDSTNGSSYRWDGSKWVKVTDYNTAINDANTAIVSRGEQLVINGNGMMGNNYNFSSLTFDGSKSNGSPGSFTRPAETRTYTISSDEFFPINPSKNYLLSFDMMSLNNLSTMYAFIDFYDVDKKRIGDGNHMYRPNTLTTLKQDLKDGDTVVYLTDASNWETTGNYRDGFIFWNYINSFGYQYPEHTYTRYRWDRLFDLSNIDKTNNTITLNTAWNHGTFPAGTKLSQSGAGATYKYLGISGSVVPNTWTSYSGCISNIDYSGGNVSGMFPPGTAYAKVGFLWNYNRANDQVWVTNISVKEDETNHILGSFLGKTGALGIWQTGLFMRDGNGTYQNICTDVNGTITRTTETTKKANPNGFEVGSPVYFSPNNTYGANTRITGSVYASYNAFDSRYSLNTTLTANSLSYTSIYLVGTIRTDGLFYLDTVWWTQTPRDSSKTYILIGECFDSTDNYCRINLYEQNNWYKYVNGKLVDYTNRLAELAATTATAYITDTTNNGIMVHPENDTTSGWSIAGAIELFKSSISYIKLWIDNNIPKIRIGKEDSKHVLIDDDSVDIVDDENVLASFGETARIGKENQGHIIIDNDSLDIRDGQKILSSFGERDIIQYDQNGAPIFWVSQFPTTDTMGIRQAVHETIYDTIEIFRRGVKLKYHPQAETKCNFSIIIEDTTDDIISESAFNIPDFESNESNEGEALYDKSITIEVIAEKRSGGDGGTYTYEATLDFNHSYTLFYISNYSFSNTAKVRLILDYIDDSSATFYQPYYSFGTRYSYVNAGIYSFVEGYNNTANGKSTHAEGYYTTADGDYSHSEGVLSLASGEMAHAEGYSCTASGNSSHAEGDGTEASNTGAHAEGSGTIASGICSHAQNWQTIAESDYQTALGKYNITDSQNKYAIIVGNGTTGNARSNAYAITWDGDTEFALDVTASSGTLDADLYDAITALGWNINDITV